MKSKFSEILNCQNTFEFQCPKIWDSLARTSDDGIRHCEACNQNVYFCLTPESFIQNGKLGRCIAVPKEILPGNPAGVDQETFAGRPSYEEVQRLEQLHSQCKKWWNGALAEGSLSFPKFIGNEFSSLAFIYIAENDFKRVLTISKLLKDTTELIEIFVEAGEHLIEQKQVKLATAFLVKAHSFTDKRTHFDTKRRLISSLVEVNQFDEAFSIAQLLKNKLPLSKVAQQLKKKGEPLESQRFVDLIYAIDYNFTT